MAKSATSNRNSKGPEQPSKNGVNKIAKQTKCPKARVTAKTLNVGAKASTNGVTANINGVTVLQQLYADAADVRMSVPTPRTAEVPELREAREVHEAPETPKVPEESEAELEAETDSNLEAGREGEAPIANGSSAESADSAAAAATAQAGVVEGVKLGVEGPADGHGLPSPSARHSADSGRRSAAAIVENASATDADNSNLTSAAPSCHTPALIDQLGSSGSDGRGQQTSESRAEDQCAHITVASGDEKQEAVPATKAFLSHKIADQSHTEASAAAFAASTSASTEEISRRLEALGCESEGRAAEPYARRPARDSIRDQIHIEQALEIQPIVETSKKDLPVSLACEKGASFIKGAGRTGAAANSETTCPTEAGLKAGLSLTHAEKKTLSKTFSARTQAKKAEETKAQKRASFRTPHKYIEGTKWLQARGGKAEPTTVSKNFEEPKTEAKEPLKADRTGEASLSEGVEPEIKALLTADDARQVAKALKAKEETKRGGQEAGGRDAFRKPALKREKGAHQPEARVKSVRFAEPMSGVQSEIATTTHHDEGPSHSTMDDKGISPPPANFPEAGPEHSNPEVPQAQRKSPVTKSPMAAEQVLTPAIVTSKELDMSDMKPESKSFVDTLHLSPYSAASPDPFDKIGNRVLTPLRPNPSYSLLSVYGAGPLRQSVARFDDKGNKINRLRKSYEGQIKDQNLAGRNRAHKHEDDQSGKNLSIAVTASIPAEDWHNLHAHKAVHRGWEGNGPEMSSEFLEKLKKATDFGTTPLPRKKVDEWEHQLGFEKLKSGKASKQPSNNATPSSTAAPVRSNGFGVGSTPVHAPARTGTPGPAGGEAARPRRSGKKRRYNDDAFEGYGEGFVDDDVGSEGGDSSNEGSRSGRKKRRKDSKPSGPPARPQGGQMGYGPGMIHQTGIGAYSR